MLIHLELYDSLYLFIYKNAIMLFTIIIDRLLIRLTTFNKFPYWMLFYSPAVVHSVASQVMHTLSIPAKGASLY